MELSCKYPLIAIVAFATYYNTLYGTFVFDDSEAIVKNKDVLPRTPLPEVFTNDFWGTDISLNRSHKSYRPLTILTYRLNVMFADGKLNAFHFHLVNVLLYVVVCLLTTAVYETFALSRACKVSDDPVFLAGWLFAVHPVHVESVAALVGRADLLAACLFFVVILLYRTVEVRNSVVLLLSLVAIVFAAVLCKETAITVIIFCVADDVYRVLKSGEWGSRWFLVRNALLVCSGACILFLRLMVMNFEGPVFTKIDNPSAYCDDFVTKVLTYNYVYFLNFLLLLWPQWLCFDWSMGCVPLIESFCDIRVVFVIFFWILIVFTAKTLLTDFLITKKLDTRFLGLSLIVFPFLPASNLFLTVGFVVAERTLLVPSAGHCFLVVLGLKKLQKHFKRHKNTLNMLFCCVCAVYSFRTINRNSEWLNEKRLFASALNVCPLNAKVHYNVAKIAADNNDTPLALFEYRKAISLNPDYEQAMNNLANLLREDKHFTEAEQLLRKAVKVRPNFAAAWMNLGIVLTNLNQTSEAETCYLTAISFRPKYPDCYYNLGNLYLDLKRNEDALRAWEQAVRHRPTHTAAWSNTLVLLDSMSRYDEALELGKTALLHNPRSPALHFTIGNTLGKLRKFERAEKHFLEAINLSGKNALYFSNLGVLYHRWGKTERAREMYEKALEIEPSMRTTEKNLRKLTHE